MTLNPHDLDQLTDRERVEHELDMDLQQMEVSHSRIMLNLRELDKLNKKETEQFGKLQRKP